MTWLEESKKYNDRVIKRYTERRWVDADEAYERWRDEQWEKEEEQRRYDALPQEEKDRIEREKAEKAEQERQSKLKKEEINKIKKEITDYHSNWKAPEGTPIKWFYQDKKGDGKWHVLSGNVDEVGYWDYTHASGGFVRYYYACTCDYPEAYKTEDGRRWCISNNFFFPEFGEVNSNSWKDLDKLANEIYNKRNN